MSSITFYDSSGTITSVVDPSISYASGTAFNTYGTALVTPGAPVVILSQVVSADETIRIGSFTVWGDIDADFVVKQIIGTVLSGVRTSPSRTTETIGFASPLTVVGPCTIQITAQHWGSASETMKANLAGTLNTNG